MKVTLSGKSIVIILVMVVVVGVATGVFHDQSIKAVYSALNPDLGKYRAQSSSLNSTVQHLQDENNQLRSQIGALNALKPNIQATEIYTPQGSATTQLGTVYNGGRVSSSGSFDYTTAVAGKYTLVFDNTFSFSAYKVVSASYTVAGTSYTKSFTVNPGTNQTFPYDLATGQRLVGQFTVNGGSGNDVNFYIISQTCTQTVNFAFDLVNSGSADGYATVQFQVDGQMFWHNRYFVAQGQHLPEGGSIVLGDCVGHVYDILVSQTEKA
jgi:hypothetical protein